MKHKLSGREYEVLLWAARGKTYAEIGAILGLSRASIKTYLDATRYKLQASNLPHAVALAFIDGIITRRDFDSRSSLSDGQGEGSH